MAATTLEKKYQRVAAEAVEYACKEFGVGSDRVTVAFSEHDCIVDVFKPGATVSTRFVYFYEED
jgi:hypothetical protein